MQSGTRLIVVSGAPGSGKTTLARMLGERIHYPVIGRDALKEVLLDTLPPSNRQESSRLGVASWPMMYAVLDALVDRVPGVIIESNFRAGRSEAELRPYADRCNSFLVHCTAAWNVIERRIVARQDDPNRHPGHFDQVALPELREQHEAGQFAPLELEIPRCIVRTDVSSGYEPTLGDLVEIIERRFQAA